MRRIPIFLLISCICFMYASIKADTQKDDMNHILRFEKVDENLFRGAQPDYNDLVALKAQGIKKIINFRHEAALVKQEEEMVRELGLEYIPLPWTIWGAYKKEMLPAFFNAIKDKDEKPVFFHCRRGVERTGIISGLYKMKTMGLTQEEALAYINKSDVKFVWQFFVRQKLQQYSADIERG